MARTSAHYSADQVNPFNKKPYLKGNDLTMRHLLILAFACISLSSTAQVIDTTMTGNAVHMNLNLTQLDSTIRSLQEIVEAQQAAIESLQAGSSFDGDYNSLSNLPTIPSKTSDLTNDAGFTTFDGDYNSLSNQLSQKDIVEFAYSLSGGANLSGADLGLANLSGHNLYSANLSGANLDHANLSNAILPFADLSNANLSGAILSGAILQGVTWTGAYILGCTGCTCVDADNNNYCD